MKERPILFSGPMVRALLDGSKTQTRRIVKPPYTGCLDAGLGANTDLCPYGQPGDRLWVREAWAETRPFGIPWPATMTVYREGDNRTDYGGPWKPSIHMKRSASRITLEITEVHVERLQDISEADALAEGIVRQRDGGYGLADTTHYHFTDPRQSYFSLWEAINGAGSVEANPWVWAVTFRRLP